MRSNSHSNILGFERLLARNFACQKSSGPTRGSDMTGFRTPDLCRRLLQMHPNLYMEIKNGPSKMPARIIHLLTDGKIKPDWLQLFVDFPDRFIIGSDQHYPEPKGLGAALADGRATVQSASGRCEGARLERKMYSISLLESPPAACCKRNKELMKHT